MGGGGGYICTECGKIVAGKVLVLLLLVVGRGFLGVCVRVCVVGRGWWCCRCARLELIISKLILVMWSHAFDRTALMDGQRARSRPG